MTVYMHTNNYDNLDKMGGGERGIKVHYFMGVAVEFEYLIIAPMGYNIGSDQNIEPGDIIAVYNDWKETDTIRGLTYKGEDYTNISVRDTLTINERETLLFIAEDHAVIHVSTYKSE